MRGVENDELFDDLTDVARVKVFHDVREDGGVFSEVLPDAVAAASDEREHAFGEVARGGDAERVRSEEAEEVRQKLATDVFGGFGVSRFGWFEKKVD